MDLVFVAGRDKPHGFTRATLEPAHLKEVFGTYTEGDKDGPAAVPATFKACGCPKCEAWALGHTDHRLGENVTALTGFCIDLDHMAEDDLVKVLQNVQETGVEAYWWNTHSNNPPSDCRARILIPFAAPYPIPHARAWSHYAWPKLCEFFGVPMAADDSCRDPSRLYFLPRRPVGSDPSGYEAGSFAGRPFDWTAILDVREAASPPPVLEIAPVPRDESREVNRDALRKMLESVRTPDKVPLIQNLLAGRALAPPPGKRMAGAIGRDMAWTKITATIANMIEGWESSAAVLEICRNSWLREASEAKEAGVEATTWEKIGELFESARAKVPSWKAEKAAQLEDLNRSFREQLGRGQLEVDPLLVQGEEPLRHEEDELDELGEPKWWKYLLPLPTKSNEPKKFRNCGSNLYLILSKGDFRNVFRMNELSHELEVSGGGFTRGGEVRTSLDTDATAVANLLERVPEFAFYNLPARSVEAQIMLVAASNTYNPLKRYFESLKWDGVSRVENALHTYWHAKTTEHPGPASDSDGERLIRAFSKRFFIGAVARAMTPGVKFDTVLVLEGPQGCRKTTSIEVLGGPFYCNVEIDPHAKDTLQALSKGWLYEIPEIDKQRRYDSSSLKDFYSRREDTYRPPYGRNFKICPRQCAFIGSTNKNEYLTDPTGNRRYWPIWCDGLIDTEALLRDRDQLWAEALVMFRAGEKHYLNEEETALHKLHVEDRVLQDPIEDIVKRFILSKPPASRKKTMKAIDFFEELAKFGMEKHSAEIRIANALRKLRCRRERRMEDGARAYVYVLSDELQFAPQYREKSVVEELKEQRGLDIINGGRED